MNMIKITAGKLRKSVEQESFCLHKADPESFTLQMCPEMHARLQHKPTTRSDARRSTTGTTTRLRLLGRELARAQQLPPPRAPRAQTAAPTIFVRQSDAESVGGLQK